MTNTTATATIVALEQLNGSHAHLAWAILVERHGADIWRIICARVRDKHSADDVYQEFWLNLPSAAKKFIAPSDNSESAARNWLLRVAYTTALMYLRKVKVRAQQSKDGFDTLSVDMVTAPPRELMEIDDMQSNTELHSKVNKAMAELPEDYRRPVLLHVVGGLSYEDLADDLQCTVNNARVRVHRGLKQVRKFLGLTEERSSSQHLSGLLIPAAWALPAVPPLPIAMDIPVPAAKKALILARQTWWKNSPLISLSVAGIAGTGIFIATHNYESPMQETATLQPIVVAEKPSKPDIAINNKSIYTKYVIDYFQSDGPSMQVTFQGDKATQQPRLLSTTESSPLTALEIVWPEIHGFWMTCRYKNMQFRRLSMLAAPRPAFIEMRLKLASSQTPIEHIGIRFNDAKGEIFEFIQAPQPVNDWQTVTFPLEQQFANYWSSNKSDDGIIDYPLVPRGYSLRFKQRSDQSGQLLIDEVALYIDEQSPTQAASSNLGVRVEITDADRRSAARHKTSVVLPAIED
jgi:RNA polymerase sigma-70 factor, ECF subfamily